MHLTQREERSLLLVNNYAADECFGAPQTYETLDSPIMVEGTMSLIWRHAQDEMRHSRFEPMLWLLRGFKEDRLLQLVIRVIANREISTYLGRRAKRKRENGRRQEAANYQNAAIFLELNSPGEALRMLRLDLTQARGDHEHLLRKLLSYATQAYDTAL